MDYGRVNVWISVDRLHPPGIYCSNRQDSGKHKNFTEES